MPAPAPSNLIDRVDEHDRLIGTVKRGKALALGANFRVVHVLVFNSQGHVLLQQVGRNRDRSPLRWGSSVAGYLHAGETYDVGASRRAREELCLNTPLVYIGNTAMRDLDSVKFIAVYIARAEDVSICEPGHIEQLRFVSLLEVDQALHDDHRQFTDTFRHVYPWLMDMTISPMRWLPEPS